MSEEITGIILLLYLKVGQKIRQGALSDENLGQASDICIPIRSIPMPTYPYISSIDLVRPVFLNMFDIS